MSRELIVSGIGITSAIGQGKEAFIAALLEGRHRFDYMQRPGRQNNSRFIGAEIPSITFPDAVTPRTIRSTSLSGQAALATLHEAWEDARLGDVAPERLGLVVGGSNFQQREMALSYERFREKPDFVSPTYGMTFMDSDVGALCTGQFGIKGLAYSVGGASASGQLAIVQAIHAVMTEQVDACIALGALMDPSFYELQALRSLGAMGSDRFHDRPEMACRPFDKNHDGFIFGESCGAVVIEVDRGRHGVRPYAALLGWALNMDGNRNPNPSYEGELNVLNNVLKNARISAQDVDYINPHGTGSLVGDETELKAIRDGRLSHCVINTTKSVMGHGLSAAGTVEAIAVMLQMRSGKLHPCLNMDEPIDPSYNWVGPRAISHGIQRALNLSFGFGGINTAICLQNAQ